MKKFGKLKVIGIALALVMALAGIAYSVNGMPVLVLSPNGSFTTKLNLNSAIASAATANKTLYVMGWTPLTASLTVPSTHAVKVVFGGYIDTGAAYTLTLNGPFEAGRHKAFSGTGPVVFPTGSTVYAEWAGITGTADNVGINKAINYVAAGGTVIAGGAYNISGTINMFNQNTTLDMTGSIVTSSASITSYFSIANYFNTLKGVRINKTSGTVTQAIYITGRNHTLEDISSMDQKFPVFMYCEDMWDTHLTRMRVDGDVTNRAGIIIKAAQSVNVTVTECSFQYQGVGIWFTDNGGANDCEGWMITATSLTMLNTAIKGDFITSLQVSNSMLDLNKNMGIELTNGHTALISNNWFGTVSDTTGITFVAAGNNFSHLTVTGNKFTGMGKTISTAISSTSPYAVFAGNTMENINGGLVMWVNSSVYGNTYDANSNKLSLTEGTMLVEGGLKFTGMIDFGNGPITGTATTGVPGSSALPTLVSGFLTVKIGGAEFKLPYYNP